MSARSGLTAFPINNTVVIRNDVLAADPAIAPAVYAAFHGAKKAYVERLKLNGPQARDEEADARYMEETGDPLPTGIEVNRPALEMIVQFAIDQQIIKTRFSAEELFPIHLS